MANCGLLGQITYADNSLYPTAYGGGVGDQTQYYSHDATKVSYNSVSQAQPLLANPSPVYQQQQSLQYQYQVPQQQQQQQLSQYQQQLNYQPTGYNNLQYQYPSLVQQSNLIQQSAPAPQYVQQQSYSSAPFVQNVQYSVPQQQQLQQQQYQPQQYYSNAADVSYNYVNVPATGYAQNLNYNHNGNQQQYFNVQQTAPVQVQQYQQQQYQQPQQQQQQQQYQLVQPLQQTVVNVPQKPVQRVVQKPTVTVDYLPATTALPPLSVTKNAHHYPAPAHVLHKQQQQSQYVNPTVWNHQTAPVQQQQLVNSYKAPNSVFRTSFSGLQGQQQQQIVVAPSNVQQPQRVIESGPHFTHTVTPTGAIQSPPQQRPSLQSNPIRIPSAALVAPVAQQNSQNQLQLQQQQPQQSQRAFSPSTAVSHTTFEGMGVRYEW